MLVLNSRGGLGAWHGHGDCMMTSALEGAVEFWLVDAEDDVQKASPKDVVCEEDGDVRPQGELVQPPRLQHSLAIRRALRTHMRRLFV